MTNLRLYDNTRMSDAKRCLRFYFYRHHMNWTTAEVRVPLVFGSAWHAAQEVIWDNAAKMGSTDLVSKAFDAFVTTWCKGGMPHPHNIGLELEKELSPRTPGRALEMIVGYIMSRLPRIKDLEVISIEKPFAVPLDPTDDTLFYVGKIDKIVRWNDKVLGIEHKTTTAYKKNGPFRSGFVDSFSPNSQVDGYLYALHLMFPGDVGGIWVDAALVHKEVEGFTFIPVERKLEHLDTWLWEVRWWINIIEQEKAKIADLANATAKPYMEAFPKNTNSCWDFGASCPYLDLCKAWPNPLGKPLPTGFSEIKWDPLENVPGLSDIVDKAA
jgi:hypothetical protein